jgi:hypothetical protein
MSIRITRSLATALDYNGCGEIVRCEAFDSDKTSFFWNGPRFDFLEVQKESQDETLPVLLPAILRSVEKIARLEHMAARSGGVWSAASQQRNKK